MSGLATNLLIPEAVSHHEPPYSDYRSLIAIAARAPGKDALSYRPLVAQPHPRLGAADRLNGKFLTLSLIAIALSFVGAWWATLRYQAENASFRLVANPATQAARDAVPAPRVVQKGDVPRSGVVSSSVPGSFVQATTPLGWKELTLMLRTGLSDDEIIADAASKQLTIPIGPEQESVLRGMGAGNRLIGYLRNQRVYGAPLQTAPVRIDEVVSIQAAAAPQATYAPAAQSAPAVDYAARDRQVASLKKRIDELDEEMRVVRSNPRDYRYWPCYGGPYGRVDQLRYDAFMKR